MKHFLTFIITETNSYECVGRCLESTVRIEMTEEQVQQLQDSGAGKRGILVSHVIYDTEEVK